MTNGIPLRPLPDRLDEYLPRACFAAVKAKANPHMSAGDRDPVEVAKRLYGEQKGIIAYVQRADQTVGQTGVSGWASQLSQQATGAWLKALAPLSAAAGLIARGMVAPIGANGSLRVPVRSTDPVAAGGVAEGDPIPVTSSSLASVTLTPKKAAVMTVVTRELARGEAGLPVFMQMLREDAARTLDALYFATTDATTAAPAGLLYGASHTFSAVIPDAMGEMAEEVSASGSGEVVFIMSPRQAAALPIRAPLVRATVLPSLAVPTGRIVAVDPASIVHGYFGEPEIEAAEEAVLHMSDDPDEIVAANGAVADPTRSLWQTDAVALRMILDIAFAARRTGAVVYADGVQW